MGLTITLRRLWYYAALFAAIELSIGLFWHPFDAGLKSAWEVCWFAVIVTAMERIEVKVR